MDTADLALLPMLLPLSGAALAMLSKAFAKGRFQDICLGIAGWIGLGLAWIPMGILLPKVLGGQEIDFMIGTWRAGSGIYYRFDGLAWGINALSLILCGLSWMYSRSAGPKGPTFSAIYLIQVASVAAAASTFDLFNLFVCLEVMGMASYVLISEAKTGGSYLAAFTYLMSSAATMLLFLVGTYGLYRLTGSLQYSEIGAYLAACPPEESRIATLCAICIVIPIILRAAVMPLSGWLLLAHSQAPHPVSAVLSGVLLKVPLFVLLRLLLVFPSGPMLGSAISIAGVLSAFVAVVLALCQSDAKRLLAYHSISQTGYVAAAFGASIPLLSGGDSALGLALLSSSFLHALGHGIFKSLLFLSVGNLVDASGERNVYTLRGGASLLRRSGDAFGLSGLSFTVGALSIAAIPPFIGFSSKGYLSSFLPSPLSYSLVGLAAVGTVASFIKLGRIFFLPSPAAAPLPGTRLGFLRLLAPAALALLCLAGGLAGPWLLGFAATLLNPGSDPGLTVKTLYSVKTLLATGATTLSGIAIFLFITSKPGKRLTGLLGDRHVPFETVFVGMAAAMLILAARI